MESEGVCPSRQASCSCVRRVENKVGVCRHIHDVKIEGKVTVFVIFSLLCEACLFYEKNNT